MASKVIEAGGSVIMDNTDRANTSYNKSGEGVVQQALEKKYGKPRLSSKGYNIFSKKATPKDKNAPKGGVKVEENVPAKTKQNVKPVGTKVEKINLSIEAIPSNSDGSVNDVYDSLKSDSRAKDTYTKEFVNEVINSNEAKALASELGLDVSFNGYGKGQWIGDDGVVQNNPNFEVSVKNTKDSESFNDRVNAYASYLGGILNQDGIGKSKTVPTTNKVEKNAVRIEFNTEIDYKDIENINKAIGDTFATEDGEIGYYITTKGGGKFLDIIREDGKDYSNFMQDVYKLLKNSRYNLDIKKLYHLKIDSELIFKDTYNSNIQKIEKEVNNATRQRTITGRLDSRDVGRRGEIRSAIHSNSKLYQALE
ncbi:hypothetical protein, partial [Campylobacter geochelonis]|uniref:hypothetical protein n=1 Tax=Campylobacter geochelonis TaxID=1780362 RepID=UPI000A7DE990